MISLLFSSRHGVVSAGVEFMQCGHFAHVDFVLPSGALLGARFLGGVKARAEEGPFKRRLLLTLDAPDCILDSARSQYGRRYDWVGALGIPLRRDWQDTEAWFCSELVAWAFQQHGIHFVHEKPNRVLPRTILTSTALWERCDAVSQQRLDEALGDPFGLFD